MNKITIPKNIKLNILFNKLFNIVMGIIGISILVGLQIYCTDMIKENVSESLLYAFPIAYIFIAIFIIAYPLILILTNADNKKIIKNMKKYGITEKMLSNDYKNAKKYGKTKIGELCTYSNDFYHYYIVPNARILYVNKRIKTRTYRKVNKYKNGAIQEVKYNIVRRHMYYVRIMDIDGKSFLISCNKEETADKIVSFFQKFKHILTGDINNTSFRKKLRKQRLDAKKKEKMSPNCIENQNIPPEFNTQ